MTRVGCKRANETLKALRRRLDSTEGGGVWRTDATRALTMAANAIAADACRDAEWYLNWAAKEVRNVERFGTSAW